MSTRLCDSRGSPRSSCLSVDTELDNVLVKRGSKQDIGLKLILRMDARTAYLLSWYYHLSLGAILLSYKIEQERRMAFVSAPHLRRVRSLSDEAVDSP